MSETTTGIIAIVIGSIIGGAVPSLVKIGVLKIPPFSYSFLRFFLASILVLL